MLPQKIRYDEGAKLLILDTLNLIEEYTYIRYKDRVYQQVDAIATGYNHSGSFANLALIFNEYSMQNKVNTYSKKTM